MAQRGSDEVQPLESTQVSGFEPTESYTIQVQDMYGHHVKSFNVNAQSADMKSFNFRPYMDKSGLYLIRITKARGEIEIRRILFVE